MSPRIRPHEPHREPPSFVGLVVSAKPKPADPLEELREKLERQGTPRETGLSRNTEVNRANKPRLAKRRAMAFGPCARMARLTPCCVPGCRSRPPGDPAHVQSRGAGGKDWANVAPLCRAHHDEQHAKGIPAFEKDHNLSLSAVAAFVADAVREHTCAQWRERTKRGHLRCRICLAAITEATP